MTRLSWSAVGSRFFEAGVDRGVYYPKSGPGVDWSGLTAVNEEPTTDGSAFKHQDGISYKNKQDVGSFAAKIEAYIYPEEFDEADLVVFGFSYRTMLGDDILGMGRGYKIHLVYNASAEPSESELKTLNDSIEPLIFTWQVTTVPTPIELNRASAHIFIDSTKAYAWAISELEDILYGTDTIEPRLPSITEVLGIFENASILKITDHGDGSWTAEGPAEAITMLDATTFQIDWPSAVFIDEESYIISSL